MSIVEIEKMSSVERLQIMERLWDVMCREPEEPKSPDWHGDILARRRGRIDSGEAKFFSLEEVRNRLRQ